MPRAIRSFEITLKTYLRRLLDFASDKEVFDIDVKNYAIKSVLLSIMLTFAGDSPHDKIGRAHV